MDKRDERAFTAVADAIVHARAKHGDSIEAGDVSHERRLRIMVEEVGEIARAIEDHENAAALDPLDERRPTAVCDAYDHLRAEVAQVGSTAVRWLTWGTEEPTLTDAQLEGIDNFVLLALSAKDLLPTEVVARVLSRTLGAFLDRTEDEWLKLTEQSFGRLSAKGFVSFKAGDN